MNINQVIEVFRTHASHIEVTDLSEDGQTVTLIDLGSVTTTGPDKGWTLVGPNWHRIENIMTEDELVHALRRTYIPSMALHDVEVGYKVILPNDLGNFFWDFIFHATWRMWMLEDPFYQKPVYDKVIAFLANHSKSTDFVAVFQGYLKRFKLEIE